MKSVRRGPALVALALCLLLSACGGGEAGTSAKAAPFEPRTAAQTILDSGAFSEPLEEMPADTACDALYHIDQSTVTDCVVYTTLTAGAEELAVLTLKDEAAAGTALAALKQRVADQKEALASYQPEEVGKLDSALVEQRGTSVLLVVPADGAKAKAALDAIG